MPTSTESQRDPTLSCSVKPYEMDLIKDYMAKHNLDGAKLIRLAVEQFTQINLSGTRHRSLVGNAPTPQQTKFIQENIKFVDQASITKLFASTPN